MPRIRLIVVLALAAGGLAAAPAQAAQVILVDGNHARRVDDPDVPSRASVRLPPAVTAATVARSATSTRADRRAVYAALGRAERSRGIAQTSYRRWRVWYVRALRTYAHLRGARKQQLGYVIDSVEALALAGRLTSTRMPGVFVQLERNRRYWRALPYPGVGDQVSFKGSELLYQYYPGRGLQLQVLSTFKKANNMHGACERGEPTCDRAGLQRLLDEMAGLAVQRTKRWIAWEYGFYFDGGYPPWISGMAEATGIQAYARAAQLLGKPEYVTLAKKALGAFETPPPAGVRTRGFLGGVHYLQYSFAPRTYIFNAFTQALIGLYDFSRLTGDQQAMRLYREAEPELRREIPYSDIGDWTLYNYRGPEANRDYHELLREVLDSMCIRRLGDVYCTYAERYRGYQVDPPVLTYTGPGVTTAKQLTPLRFTVSKLSAVEVKVYRGERVVFSRLATFRRGTGAFAWRPGAPGTVTVRLAAKELRTGLGKKAKTSAQIEIDPAQ
jgi:D-glucuronyl C5-epimerase C-terminus